MESFARHVTFTLLAAASLGAPLGCDDPDPTLAIVDNAFPPPPQGGEPSAQTAVFKVWWSVTLFSDPVAAGASSQANRVVPGREAAYALLAPGWDPASGTPPTTLIPVKLRSEVSAARGDTVHITIAEATVDGLCASGTALSQDDADLITHRIFPGDFANVTYDAARCISTPQWPEDGGSTGDATTGADDGASDAGVDGAG
jgi:hypothetical protein